MLTEKWEQKISQYALQSLLYEVSASPKPGLVDRFNSGAHQDMDFFTFMASSASLAYYFHYCVNMGVRFAWQNPKELFQSLRKPGMEAERDMFQATNHVNTQKGLIFSLGIICAAAASCMLEEKNTTAQVICQKVRSMTDGLCEKELVFLNKKGNLTNGEKLYKKYGITGIRGEVEKGFPTVCQFGLPVFQELKKTNRYHVNDILVQTLLHLMANNIDTNIVARHDLDTLTYVQQYAHKTLEVGGILTEKGRNMVFEMDRVFIQKNISPGGSADLLAVTFMLDALEQIELENTV